MEYVVICLSQNYTYISSFITALCWSGLQGIHNLYQEHWVQSRGIQPRWDASPLQSTMHTHIFKQSCTLRGNLLEPVHCLHVFWKVEGHMFRIEPWDPGTLRWQGFMLCHQNLRVYELKKSMKYIQKSSLRFFLLIRLWYKLWNGKGLAMHLLQHLQTPAEGTISLKVKFTDRSISVVWSLVATVSSFGTASLISLLCLIVVFFTCTNRTVPSGRGAN